MIRTLRGEVSFDRANEFCRQVYYRRGILEKGKDFLEKPDIYILEEEEGSPVATMGLFVKKRRKDNLLPLEKTFVFTCEDDSVEVGRFSITPSRKRNNRKILKDIYHFILSDPFVDPSLLYPETRSDVVKAFNKAVGGVFYPLSSPIRREAIPPQSVDFYFSSDPPRLFQVMPVTEPADIDSAQEYV